MRVHRLILPVAVALWFWRPPLGPRYLLLVAALLWHELAHAATALALGKGPALVRLWPAFGRADVEAFSDRREALVALAAPLANLLAALAAALAGGRLTLALGTAPLPDFLVTVHLVMGVGNLLPIPPADGGRALRAFRRPVSRSDDSGLS